MLRLFVLFITFPPKKSVRADKCPGALFVYYILFFSRVGREGRAFTIVKLRQNMSREAMVKQL